MMRRRSDIVAGLALAGLLAAARPSDASCNLVVDPAGGGTHATIQAAIDALPGVGACRIVVKAGTYHESVTIAGKNDQANTEEARIVLAGDRGAIVAPDGDHAFVIAGSRFLTIDGFTITAARREAIVLEGGALASADVTLSRNDIHNNGSGPSGGGILVGPRNDRVWIVNNLVRNNGRNGIVLPNGSLDGAAVYVVNNTILSNGWNGISVGRQREAYVINNLVMSNGVDGGVTGGRWGLMGDGSLAPDAATLVTLKSNLYYRNGARAPAGSGGDIFEPAQVLDTTDSGNATTTGREGTGTAGCTIPSCAGAPLSAFFGGTGFGPDFHLIPGAPAVRRGVGSFIQRSREWIPDVDVDGEKRNRDLGTDVGWDELSGGPLSRP